MEIEFEERVMLSKEQYLNILSAILKDKPYLIPIKQENLYYDTKDNFLNKNGHILRIRKKNAAQYEITLKTRGIEGDNEYTDKLNLQETRHFITFKKVQTPEVLKGLSLILCPSNKVKFLTTLSTVRYEVPIDNYLLVIDMNTYNNITDYNLEIEASSKEEAKKIILCYCKDYQIEYKDDYIVKSKRALLSLNN